MNGFLSGKRTLFPRLHWQWIGVGGAVILLLLPFVLLSFFTHPFYDDYMEAVRVQRHGLMGAQQQLYEQHTGRFVTSWLFTAANPLVWGWEWGSRVVPLLVMAGLAALFRWVSRLAYPRLAGWQHCIVAMSLLLLYLCSITSPYEAVYWFTGAVVYQTGTVCLLLLGISSWYHRAAARRKVWPWLVASLAVVGAVAANEVALAQTVLLLLLLAGVSWAGRGQRPDRAWWTWLCALALLVSAVCLLAPGNYHRMSYKSFDNRFQLSYAIPHTLVSVGEIITRPVVWLGFLGITLAVLYADRAAKGWQLHPLLAGLHWLAGIGSGFFSFWWLGFGPAPARTENAIIAGTALALVTLLPPVIRWARARGFSLAWVPGAHTAWFLAGAMLVLAARGTPLQAWRQLCYNARPYEQQMQRRYQVLRRAQALGKSYATVPPLQLPLARGIFMHATDLDSVPDTELNTMTAAYFGLDSVQLRPAHAGRRQP